MGFFTTLSIFCTFEKGGSDVCVLLPLSDTFDDHFSSCSYVLDSLQLLLQLLRPCS